MCAAQWTSASASEDEAFRREVAGLARRRARRRVRRAARARRLGRRRALVDERRAWEKQARRGRLDLHRLAARARRPRRRAHPAGDLLRGVRARRRPGTAQPHGRDAARPDAASRSGATRRSGASCRGIVAGDEIWCQGYSEPNAGSDLANVQTRARLDGDEWVIDGQKVWTSWAAWADWCFVVRRTDPASKRHAGPRYLLVPMKQPGVEIRPIQQITGDAEFFEVFYDGARTARENVVGRRATAGRSRWRRSPSSAASRRSASRCCSATSSTRSSRIAKQNGRASDPLIRQRIADAWMGLEIQRYNALRTLVGRRRALGRRR